MSGFIIRETFDWNEMVKTAGLKLAQPMPPMAPPAPAAPTMDPAGPKMEEGMPIADGRKPSPDEVKPDVAAEPTEFLAKEHKEIENAKAIVLQMWGLLTGEAGEGGFDEVKYLLDAIKSMEDFITVEETGVKPGKGKKSASFFRYAGKIKEVLLPLYEALSAAREKALGRPLTDDEESEMWEEAAKVYSKKLKPSEPAIEESKPDSFLPEIEEAPAPPMDAQQSGELHTESSKKNWRFSASEAPKLPEMGNCRECKMELPKEQLSGIETCPECSKKWVEEYKSYHRSKPSHYRSRDSV